MTEEEIARHKQVLRLHLPEGAVDELYNFLRANNVRLHITRERRSKLGDYKCPQLGHQFHEISVNGDLNRYYFLLVLLHEMAHLDTFLLYQNSVKPHGHEWQEQYRRRLKSFVRQFPSDVAELVGKYVRRIPLNQTIGKQIESVLMKYNPGYDPAVDLLLKDLEVGARFRIKTRPHMVLEIEEKRRTRYRCVDVATGNMYLVAGNAPVIKC